MSTVEHVVIAGGTGFLGLNLARVLRQEGHRVTLVSRHPPTESGWDHVEWDGRGLGSWVKVLEGATGLVNLAGRSVDCVKTPENCDAILRSRVESTRVLGEALRRIDRPPGVWVQMATAHRYGDPLERVCDEDSAFGYGLAPTVGQAWEDTFADARPPEMRGVILRTSFVLGREGGALPRLAMLVRMGLGGRVGHGRQGISWIHETDMNRLFVRALTDPTMSGAYLATAPEPVSNARFMRALRGAMGVPFGLPSFGWMVRLGAPLLMHSDPELALYGRYCVSRRLREEGFGFRFPDVTSALEDLYAARRRVG
ncbi:MAG: TIGR01777 family oxidoreductase [Longimicrobiales bacterium]|nr:TIGR01777 family oxidoreductase [Longimicrobiales bacterium]